ncbi:hypothetical protein F0562_007363 [Nyssa sinensis]|uniref:Uncharacterized protein n=1 Tax=Nyssa sinensis TaxID=561372 RepID=A0A5J5A692_9ASTE|nr:hypothetical protein F0562_007363 [Nyssa sinensis]
MTVDNESSRDGGSEQGCDGWRKMLKNICAGRIELESNVQGETGSSHDHSNVEGEEPQPFSTSSVGVGIEGKVVKTGCNVMGSTCVRVPILIIVKCKRCGGRCGGVSDVGLRSGGRGIVKMLVELIPTSGSCMANFGADLTRRSGGMGWWVR